MSRIGNLTFLLLARPERGDAVGAELTGTGRPDPDAAIGRAVEGLLRELPGLRMADAPPDVERRTGAGRGAGP